MPQYEKITAKSFREARQIAFQKYGSDISIVKETSREVKNWKKFWSSKDHLCEIVVAKYRGDQKLLTTPFYKGSFDELDKKKEKSDNNSQKKMQNFSKVLEKKHDLINRKLKDLSREEASWKQSIGKFRSGKDLPINREKFEQNDLKTSFDDDVFKFSKQSTFAPTFAKAEEKTMSEIAKAEEKITAENLFTTEKKSIISTESFLKKQRFSDGFIQKLMKNCPVKDVGSQESFEQLASKVASHFSFSKDFFSQKEKRFFFFLGSPGVGKTTTFFKVAVDLAKMKNRDVFLNCYDQKRLMGTAQVEKFSDILQVPFRRIESSACLKRLKKECTSDTTFLVDLGGLSLLDKQQVDEYKSLLNAVDKEKKTILILNASMGREEIDFCIKQFCSFFAIDGFALSHIDEARSLGPALSAVWDSGLPISLLCYGQDIPHDMSFATMGNLEEKLLHFFTENEAEWTRS